MMNLIQVAAAVIYRDNQVLIAQRPSDKHKGGYWEFPGGKIEEGESDLSALARELKEEINIQVTQAKHFKDIQFDYPEKSVLLKFFLVTDFSGEAKGLEGQPVNWVAVDELKGYRFPEANVGVVEEVVSLWGKGELE